MKYNLFAQSLGRYRSVTAKIVVRIVKRAESLIKCLLRSDISELPVYWYFTIENTIQ